MTFAPGVTRPFPRTLLLAALFLLPAAFHLLPRASAETLTLEDCLRETALNNPAVVAQARDIERALGTKLTIRSRALPLLGIGGLLGYQGQQDDVTLVTRGGKDANGNDQPDVSTVQTRGPQFLAIGSLALYQPLLDVAVPAAWRRGGIEAITSQQNYYSIAVTRLYQTRLLFNRALFYRDNGALLAGIDRAYEGNIKTAESLVNAGLTGRQSLLQAQTQRAGFGPVINSATGSYRATVASLLASMGREQQRTGSGDLVANLRLEGSLDESALLFDARAAARDALAHRPDLEGLRSLARALREDARITRGGYYPLVRVYVTGDLIPDSFTRSDRPNALREGDSVRTTEIRPGIRYDWNVVDTGLIRGGAQSIDRTREQTEISLKALEDNIPRTLARLRATLDRDTATLRATRENSTVAQDTLNIISDTVAKGTGTQLDFMNAQTGLLVARSSLLGARLDASNARAEYDFVTGRYLRFVPTANVGRSGESALRPVK